VPWLVQQLRQIVQVLPVRSLEDPWEPVSLSQDAPVFCPLFQELVRNVDERHGSLVTPLTILARKIGKRSTEVPQSIALKFSPHEASAQRTLS